MVRYNDRYSIEDLLRLATHVYGKGVTTTEPRGSWDKPRVELAEGTIFVPWTNQHFIAILVWYSDNCDPSSFEDFCCLKGQDKITWLLDKAINRAKEI